MLGQETALAGQGPLTAWHLAAPGQRRFELWLAPDRDWYPVQLRAVDAHGTVTTQLTPSGRSAAAVPAPQSSLAACSRVAWNFSFGQRSSVRRRFTLEVAR